MANLGVFRDEFYNAISVLTHSQSTQQSAAASGVIPAAALAGAEDCYVVASGGAAVTETTDTAINIITALNNAVNVALKANVGGFAASLGSLPPQGGIPNLFNMSWTVVLNNQNTGTITFAGGVGVTVVTTGITTATIATLTSGTYVVTVTSPTTVTFTRVL